MPCPPLSTTPTRANLVKPHIESFNSLVEKGGGLMHIVNDLPVVSLDVDEISNSRSVVQMRYTAVEISNPMLHSVDKTDQRLYPSHCRESNETYAGDLIATVAYKYLDMPAQTFKVALGKVPVMLMSSKCNLAHFSKKQLVNFHEEETELGGYFIAGGNEKLIRMIILPRRHIMMALKRSQFKAKQLGYSEYAVSMRCVRADQTAHTVAVHYLTSGLVTLRFSIRRREFFVSAVVLLKAFAETTDREIFDCLTNKDRSNQFVCDRAALMLREASDVDLNSQEEFLEYFGECFRSTIVKAEHATNIECAEKILEDYIFIHCETKRQKFDVLILMIQRLFSLVEGKIEPDNADAHSMQEILLPGHLYGIILKDELYRAMYFSSLGLLRAYRKNPSKVDLEKPDRFKKEMMKCDVGKKMAYFIKTGNIKNPRDIELSQSSGFTLTAEKINFNRFLSFFRSVHRGAFFTTMRSTAVRKLLPETWGFLCPVHTPDGSPCGLLYHLAAPCEVLTHQWPFNQKDLLQTLCNLGMKSSDMRIIYPGHYVPVALDGVVVGRLPPELSSSFLSNLRVLKVLEREGVPKVIEIYAAVNLYSSLVFSEILLSTSPARAIRPVLNVACNMVEWIGPHEQVFLDIAVRKEQSTPSTTHIELSPVNYLSSLASQTPFSDSNQSPRNMYQCQMAKQTMGTPFHAFPHRADTKYYRLQTPQKPIVFNDAYRDYRMNDYPTGTNAVVAVMAYTGYDMEDAMIINKGALERGLCNGSMYKTELIDLDMGQQRAGRRFRENSGLYFGNCDPETKEVVTEELGVDGLPHLGSCLTKNSPYYCQINDLKKSAKVVKYKYAEPCIVESVKAIPASNSQGKLQRVKITLRYKRNPIVGDKFSSRHGQKGTCSQLWPQENMPFTQQGLTPDIIINPHAFPSRMTIGMLLESVAAKYSCLRGCFQDGTPFKYSESNRAVDHFGERLSQHGFNYYGTETMHSGITGEEMEAEIFMGIVNYQRLRHMVSDKSQVRSTGMVNQQTKQPVKGRKKGGGIRLGEMERDSLLAHGTAFVAQDRMLYCSDYHKLKLCRNCGSMLSVLTVLSDSADLHSKRITKCVNCKTDKHCSTIEIPFVFTFLVCELLGMNVRLTLNMENND